MNVSVISGTSGGIGLGLAEHFLSLGYTVMGCSRGEGTIRDSNYHHATLDVSDEAGVISWVKSIKKTFGKIDVLVCNAAIAPANLLALSLEVL